MYAGTRKNTHVLHVYSYITESAGIDKKAILFAISFKFLKTTNYKN